jgi:hypothetical protein
VLREAKIKKKPNWNSCVQVNTRTTAPKTRKSSHSSLLPLYRLTPFLHMMDCIVLVGGGRERRRQKIKEKEEKRGLTAKRIKEHKKNGCATTSPKSNRVMV